MLIEFAKMHGLGNDFVIIDTVTKPIHLSQDMIKLIANRKLGIGCDQLLLVTSTDQQNVDFGYRIFNADGSEAEQCGNGLRCFAVFVKKVGLHVSDSMVVATRSGRHELHIVNESTVKVNMGIPLFETSDIPVTLVNKAHTYSLQIDESEIEYGAVSMGNPHAVVMVNDIKTAPVLTLGAKMECHAAFPRRVNVGFMQCINRELIRLRVFERGVGETSACGTGACAAVAIARQRDLCEPQVDVELAGGVLHIQWEGGGHPLWMTGPASWVFKGVIDL